MGFGWGCIVVLLLCYSGWVDGWRGLDVIRLVYEMREFKGLKIIDEGK